MGAKSRGNWAMNWCPKSPDCKNYNKKCDECFRYSEYLEETEEVDNGK